MYSDSSFPTFVNTTDFDPIPAQRHSKPPQAVLDNIYAFSPNSETLGGTSYLIVEKEGNILLDCPAVDEPTCEFLTTHGRDKKAYLSLIGAAIGKVRTATKTL
ncbi:MBL fold metallo-hydrolase, partial [Nostoc sp. HG1]|nr:MBL fold metallo-hydrolase [Nostoc sp. HG1]